jgi:hypothetical protein
MGGAYGISIANRLTRFVQDSSPLLRLLQARTSVYIKDRARTFWETLGSKSIRFVTEQSLVQIRSAVYTTRDKRSN